jgi:hypothetical protein
MQHRDFTQRIVVPTSIVLAGMILSRLVYFNSSATVATLSGIVMFLSVGFGSFLIYPLSFFRGASLAERVIGCLVTPFVWNAIEIYNASEAFTVAESLFYGVNFVFLGTVSGQLLIMCICDFFCRLNERRAGQEDTRVISPFGVFACLSGLSGLYFVLIWREGAGQMYLFVKIYKAIFF